MDKKSTRDETVAKEDKMTEFRSGMALLQNANNALRKRGRLTKNIPIASLIALVISLAGCLAFCVLFHYALTGFFRQVSELIPIGDFVPIQSVNVAIAIIFSLMAVIYFIVGTISTKNIRNNVNKKRHVCVNSRLYIVKHFNLLAIMTGVTYVSVIIWVHIFAVSTLITIVYVAFITATYKVCDLFNGQCVDFNNLKPLLKPLFPANGTEISLNFCEAKRKELCRSDHNLLSLFIVANGMCLVALVSLIHFLMCMVANWKEQQVIDTSKVGPDDDISSDQESIDLKHNGDVFLNRRKANSEKGRTLAQRQDTVELLEDQIFARRNQEEDEDVHNLSFVKRLDSVVERYEDHIELQRLRNEAKNNP